MPFIYHMPPWLFVLKTLKYPNSLQKKTSGVEMRHTA